MEWYLYLAVVGAGFAAGFINTVAGSGSLITLPLLIFLGLPATVANGTNRVAILLQNVVGVASFRQQRVLDWRTGVILSIPAVIGSLIGAQIAVELDETLMRHAIGVLMVLMVIVLIVRPSRWLTGRPELVGRPGVMQLIVMFGIGVYGGFLQAGVGVFILAGLVLSVGYDLVRANAVKVLIVLAYTPFALAIFIYNDQVHWEAGLTLAVGNMLGALVASRMAVKRGAGFVRVLLIGVVLVAAAELLGVVDFFVQLFG